MAFSAFKVTKEKIRDYWGTRIPQTWYSQKEKGTLEYFRDVELKRYTVYYRYLYQEAEFWQHTGEKVLEIGVGLGTDLLQYAKSGSECYGIDLTPQAIDETKKHFDVYNLKANLKQGDAENLDFPDNYFDLVYSFGVLHHTPNTPKAIQEVYRVLKPKGKAIIMLYALGWRHWAERVIFKGILKGQLFHMSYQEVINKNTEVQGNSPLTYVMRKKEIKEMFKNFSHVEMRRHRLGPFFDFGKWLLPSPVVSLARSLNLERVIGENWLIKAIKSEK